MCRNDWPVCVCISLSLLFVGFCGYVLYYNGTYSMTFFSMLPEKSNKSCGRSKKNNLLAILNERKIRKRKSPICPTPPQKKIKERILCDNFSEEDGDDDDDGGVVPQKVFEEAKQKKHLYQNKFNEMSLQLQETRSK